MHKHSTEFFQAHLGRVAFPTPSDTLANEFLKAENPFPTLFLPLPRYRFEVPWNCFCEGGRRSLKIERFEVRAGRRSATEGIEMKAIAIAVLLSLLACCGALPVNMEDASSPLVGIPLLLPVATGLENERLGDSAPVAYALLLSKLHEPQEDVVDAGSAKQKREAKEQEGEDLETAAGSYALRPLFAYRQQMVYRQRVRDANRRRNRF